MSSGISRQWYLVGLIVVFLAVGAALAVYFGPDLKPLGVGARAPDYRAVDLATGDSVSLRERYRGSLTLVNIWATWCQPCRIEMPAMQRLYAEYGGRGFRIAAVSIDDDGPRKVRAFVDSLGLSFDILLDQSTRIQDVYQTTGVPESFLLDRDGIIIKRVIGAHDWNSAANRAAILRALGPADSVATAPQKSGRAVSSD